MRVALDKLIFCLMYILIFVAVICRIEYTALLVPVLIAVYRISLYAIIMLGFLFIIVMKEIIIKGISGVLYIMVFYELVITVVGYGSLNRTLFNEFMVDTLAWPLIFILTYSLYRDDSIRKPFKVISALGITIIFGITAVNLSRINAVGMNRAISGVPFSVAVLPLVYMFFSKKTGIAATIIAAILIIISTKRSSFLVLLIGVFAFFISDVLVQQVQRKKLNKMLALMFLSVVIFVVGMYLLDNSDIAIIQRFTNGDATLSGRTMLWQRIIKIFSEQGLSNKLFGNGMHAVKYKINPYGLGWYAHNSFIETLYDFGIIGLGMLILFIVLLIKETITMNKLKSEFAPVLSSSIPSLLFYASASYFFEVGQTILIYAFIWGLCLAISETEVEYSGLDDI